MKRESVTLLPLVFNSSFRIPNSLFSFGGGIMSRSRSKMLALAALALTLVFAVMLTPPPQIDAADHGDAPLVAQDQACDIADFFLFLDPNDNSRVVIAATVHGFIVPNEAVNFGIFDPNVRYRFEIETTGDARPDGFVDIRFTNRNQSSTQVQVATVTLPNGRTFTANATPPNLNDTAPTPNITTDSVSGVTFFAGLVDDPFNFDITGFNRFVAAV